MRIDRCDRCKVKDAILIDLFIATGESREAFPDHKLTADGALFDLCAECCAEIVKIVVLDMKATADACSYKWAIAITSLIKNPARNTTRS